MYLAMAYLLVVRACFFPICIVKGLLQLLWYLLDKNWKGTSRMSLQNRYEPRSSSQLQGQNMLSEGRVRQIHTHTNSYALFSFSHLMDVSRHRYPFVILIPLFLSLFLSSFRYKLASRRKQLSSRAASYTSPRTFARRHPI